MKQCQDKGHTSQPQEKPQATFTGGRVKGVKMGTLHGVGGGAKPGSYMFQVPGHHPTPSAMVAIAHQPQPAAMQLVGRIR